MNVAEFLKSFNTYAREYILYLIRVFALSYDTVEEHIEDADGSIIVHALISLAAGVFLQQIIIAGAGLQDKHLATNDALLRIFVNQFGFWVFIAILIHFMARAFAHRTRFTTSLSVSLRVLPPAFFLSAATSLYISKLAFAILKPSRTDVCLPWSAAIGDAVAEWVLVACALYVGLAHTTKVSDPVIPKAMKARRAVVVGTVVFFIIVTHLMIFDAKKNGWVISYCLGL